MQREGVIDIINKLRAGLPMGLHRYKLIEELRLVCFSSRSRRRSRVQSMIAVMRGAPRLGPGRAITIKPKCLSCGYDLRGHGSVLGPQLPVGPGTCPECGEDYPAVW
jgi:rRNA maturation protein Nop10